MISKFIASLALVVTVLSFSGCNGVTPSIASIGGSSGETYIDLRGRERTAERNPNSINGDGLIKLYMKPFSDAELKNAITTLGLKAELGEDYAKDHTAIIGDMFEDGFDMYFEDIEGCGKAGDPCFTQAQFYTSKRILPPYGLSFRDDYETCRTKLGKAATNESDNEGSEAYIKIWNIDNLYEVWIHYYKEEDNKGSKRIRSIRVDYLPLYK